MDKDALHKPLFGASTLSNSVSWMCMCVAYRYGSHDINNNDNVDSTLTNLINGSTHVYTLWPFPGVLYS